MKQQREMPRFSFSVLVLILLLCAPHTGYPQPKILHLTFHMGCLKEIEQVARELNLDVTPWFIPRSRQPFDGVTRSCAIYNIGQERADRIWTLHKKIFERFDAILISDIAPLCRIFLQNNWRKPLILWICNRFDYCDEATNDCNFPDPAYYELFRKACTMPNVRIVSSTPYEYIHAAAHGVPINDTVIQSIGSVESEYRNGDAPFIPATINKQETLMLPRMALFSDFGSTEYILQQCRNVGIDVYSGKYNGPCELKEFKGILYFPYQWWTVSMYENLQLGLVHFVPSKKFVFDSAHDGKLIIKGHHYCCLSPLFYEYGEFYLPTNRSCFVYFDSWHDLAEKVRSTDYSQKRALILKNAKTHKEEMLTRWERLFSSLGL